MYSCKDFNGYTVRRIRKHALTNDYAIGIPLSVVEQLGLTGKDSVKIYVRDGKMIFEPIRPMVTKK